MATYADMRNRILDEVADSALTTQVNRAILDTIKHYGSKRLYFNQTTTTFSTVANQEYYTTADSSYIPNLIHIDSMTLTQNSIKSPVLPWDFNWIDANQTGTVTGVPFRFAYYKKQLRLYPIPTDVFTITMAIHYRLTELSGDTDENEWTNDAEELIRQGAKRRLAIDVTHELPPDTPPNALEIAALYELECETATRMSNPILRVDAGIVGRGLYDINIGAYRG